jgi:nucleotide-binding universal stress UspA family protein
MQEQTTMKPFKRILVPTDFSEYSVNATLVALDLAQRYDGTVTLVHVSNPLALGMADGFAASAHAREELREESEQELETARTNAQKVGSVSVEARLLTGEAATTICEFARRGFDLIVMPTHGRSGVASVLIGSVAEQVMRLAPCPVLTIRLVNAAKTG